MPSEGQENELTWVSKKGVNILVPKKGQSVGVVPGEAGRQKKDLSRFQKVAIAASVFTVGTAGLLFGGLFKGSKAENFEDFTTGQGNEQTFTGNFAGEGLVTVGKSPFEEVYPNYSREDSLAGDEVDSMKVAISENTAIRGMYSVTKKYEQIIRNAASDFGIPEEIALGIIFIENGGGDDKTSTTGARGICQLMPETAERYGLVVELPEDHPEKKPEELVDERVNPEKCTKAMANYLADLKREFGDNLGIAVLGYYAGEGNVYKMLREDFKDTDSEHVDLGDVGLALELDDSAAYQKMTSNYYKKIKESKLDVHDLLRNQAVNDNVLVFLDKDTKRYVSIVLAGAELYLGQ